MLPLLLMAIAPQGEPSVAGLRAVRIELHQSGTIRINGEAVPPGLFAARLRSARRKAEIMCVWREPKVPDGRAAFDFDEPGDMERFKQEMRVTGLLAEASRTMPTFDQRDAVCEDGAPPPADQTRRPRTGGRPPLAGDGGQEAGRAAPR